MIRSRLALVAALLVLVACRDGLDAADAVLPAPKSLPGFATTPAPPSTAARSQELVAQGEALATAGKLQPALPILTEALALDPASGPARLALARLFARGGRSSVALALLEPAAARVADCGVCVETLQQVRGDPAFATLRASAQGTTLLARVPAAPLPYPTWAGEVAKALQAGDGAALEPYVDATAPFDLVRTCPSCAAPHARAVNRRALQGKPMAAKLASRFSPETPDGQGTPLRLVGAPTCSQRCCTWALPQPEVPRHEAALRRLCFRPVMPKTAVLTEVEVVYGATQQESVAPPRP